MMRKTWMKIGGAAMVVALLVTAGVAVAHAGGKRGQVGASVAYEGEASSGLLTNVTRNGAVLFERIAYTPADVKLAPRGGVGLRALNATTVTLTLPADATIAVHDEVEDWSPAGATITYANGEKANLVVRNGTITVDGDVLTVALEADGGLDYRPAGKPGMGHGAGFGPMGAKHGGRGPGGAEMRAPRGER